MIYLYEHKYTGVGSCALLLMNRMSECNMYINHNKIPIKQYGFHGENSSAVLRD